ncbi:MULTISPECIES: acyltransferase family protein [Bradyrhizobium]|uniref:Peptidoglycan/LPS O-acetylase OafA/YrhL, contains acyltransferase and SGNH-hydrolase domains n=2 Tax=Bradyrhizobium TaxID=374 RepID=A0ABY0PH22_9BRAD|nr:MULTISPECIES: acyltransferase family protein [Bradyrhizobium]SDI36793.1 Peptidoglycan/LPS O-acetylase OafA/YrhL, contains acyltransferase and SGNH-hydrolase domains [Bradyrhizobium ottawaense]SED60012.1 Peptidoglycan/LPS O-acetylase OafA/YrhL, contains acyltransferase and SGNH-hydrolase domains [Bradyrhizobium lablabi]SHL57717.1 Peptidoglycan/LPS O-acetylase OafA/YrhL, contains acyltransferase and SGNH-hydrolase domains [Bradyrhizobium lablabi]
MTDFSIGGMTRAASEERTASRLAFIDNIRWTMIVLVLSMHACDTYSPFGNWYYVDRQKTGFGTTVFFGVYQSFLQAFFMAVLFFIAGYFSAAAYDRKGFSRFLRDRCFRLGLPTLLYMLVIGPLTQYFLSSTWGDGGFGHQWLLHLRDGEWLSETGPMWFCAALLLFAIVYALVRLTGWKESRIELAGDRRGAIAVAAFIAVMAASTFLVRVGVSGNASILNMHPGDFPQYVLMFAAGVLGYRGNWITEFPARLSLLWGSLALALSVPLFAALIVFGGGLQGETAQYAGGFNPVSAGKCLWEALVCVGMGLLMLAIYRRYFDVQGPVARRLSDNAFGIYLIHPPILIGFAILLHPVALGAVVKAMLLTFLAAIGSFAASAFVLRQSPLRAIV